MKAELSPRIFASISQDIINGRPVWGLLRANEYLEAGTPLHQALVLKAARSTDSPESIELIKTAASGLRLSELKAEQQSSVFNLKELAPIKRVKVIPSAQMNHRCLSRAARGGAGLKFTLPVQANRIVHG